MGMKTDDMEWKEKNCEYLDCLQRFLDKADNIKEEQLRQSIIIAMLKCDEILTKLAEEEIKNSRQDDLEIKKLNN